MKRIPFFFGFFFFFLFSFAYFLPIPTYAAACPVADSADGSTDGVITISANTTWTPTATTAWDCTGLDLLVTNNATLTFGSNTTSGYTGYLQIDNLQIDSGSSISSNAKGCPANGTTSGDGLGPDASNVCTATTAGYGGKGDGSSTGSSGAGYGGTGGRGSTATAGRNYYGSAIAPTYFGSSGGTAFNYAGGIGGGVVRIEASGNFVHNGSITANGGNGTVNASFNNATGGGSGGSIFITVTGTFSGSTGTFSANGGNGGNGTSQDGGGGGGGRIALIYGSSSFSGLGSEDFTVTGGTAGTGSSATDGAKGTVYVKNSTSNAITVYHGFTYAADYSVGSWTVDSSATNQYCDGVSDATPSITTTGSLTLSGTFACTHASVTGFTTSPAGAVSLSGLTFSLGATDIWTMNAAVGVTITTSSITSNIQWTSLTSFSMDASSTLSADGLGCQNNASSSGNGYGPDGSNVCTVSTSGYGGGGGSSTGTKGAGHGGAGGNGTNISTGGATYGSSTAPTLFGSSAGNSFNTVGGDGGGIIRIQVYGNATLNGTLTVDGGNGTNGASSTASGGGSGGSLYVTVRGTLTSTTGSVSATGGNGGSDATYKGGGGGGGRIRIEYGIDSNGFVSGLAAATVAAGGSSSATAGSTGSLSTQQLVYLVSISITDNSGYTNDSTPVITISQSGATPTHVAFSCDGGSNWSAWLTYPDDDVVNDGDGPDFNFTADATGCTTTNELKTITAKIKDGTGESSSVSDTTTYDTQAPTVVSVTSTNTNGTYGADEIITVTVTFTENMSVTGTPQIELDMDGTDRQANYASTSTTTLSFTYTIVTGDNKTDLDYTSASALTLNSGTITDFAGNTATLTLASPGASGSLGANKDITIVTNQAPTMVSVTLAQGNDGSGEVSIVFHIDDPDNDDTLRVKIEYSTNNGSSWNDPTLSTADADTTATYGDPDVDNAQTYQVGQSGAYILTSSGENTVTVVWDAATDLSASTDSETIKIRVTPYDGIVEGSALASSSGIVDFVAPVDTGTSSSLSTISGSVLRWSPVTDSHFDHYEIWYGYVFSDAVGRTGSASEWDDGDDAGLVTASTSSTTIIASLRHKYAVIFAVDDYGNTTTLGQKYFIRSTSSTSSDASSSGGGGSDAVVDPYLLVLDGPSEQGAQYRAGTSLTISWHQEGSLEGKFVNLSYAIDGGSYVSIVKSYDAERLRYTWLIPKTLKGDSVIIRVQVTDLASVLTSQTSPVFSILADISSDTLSDDADTDLSDPSNTDSSESSANLLPDGSYIKGASFPTVYFVENGKRRPFPDAQTFFTHQDDFSEVVMVSDADLALYPLGTSMLPKVGRVLIKIQSVPQVYFSDSSGLLHWITTEDIARELFGENWNAFIIDVPPTLWPRFQFGAPITSSGDISVEREQLQLRVDLQG